tara:strand:- start:10 stop:498 length:489 start_codon:yes stop_codon:yes gene_type:complete
VGNHIINLNSLNNTDILARLIAKNLFPKAIVLLWGEMGSGKTTFAKSLCSGLGVQTEKVTSPTYTIANIYQGLLPIFHIDLFRLSSSQELEDFDRNDLISDEGITIVEWPKLILSFLTDEPLINLKFETVSSYTRRVELESNFNDFDKIFTILKNDNIFKNN